MKRPIKFCKLVGSVLLNTLLIERFCNFKKIQLQGRHFMRLFFNMCKKSSRNLRIVSKLDNEVSGIFSATWGEMTSCLCGGIAVAGKWTRIKRLSVRAFRADDSGSVSTIPCLEIREFNSGRSTKRAPQRAV